MKLPTPVNVESAEVIERKAKGEVFTPSPVADLLVRWAVRSSTDCVLDPGSGRGEFVVSTINRLSELGCPRRELPDRIFGVERDSTNFGYLKETVRALSGIELPNVLLGSLFAFDFPEVDALVGNPPYVERLRIAELDEVRERVLSRLRRGFQIPRLMDLYGYFVLYSASFLKPGGRVALILSDAWLKMDYGRALKEFLLREFSDVWVVSPDWRVFSGVLVKTVLLLGTRKLQSTDSKPATVHFLRIRYPLPWPSLSQALCGEVALPRDVQLETIQGSMLKPEDHWDIFVRAPPSFLRLVTSPTFTRLGKVAKSRIGLQTLARDFFILVVDEASRRGLETEYLQRILASPRDWKTPVVDSRENVGHVLVYCDLPKERLAQTRILDYIHESEREKISVRGIGREVTGFNHLPRLMRAGRNPWYNIKAEVERRGAYPILIPRRVFGRYLVLWNRNGVTANENFLEAKPRNPKHTLPLLAYLNSTVGELAVRLVGHVYGGGVCNVNPADLKLLPVPDFGELPVDELERLAHAFLLFAEKRERWILDKEIFFALDITEKEATDILHAVGDLAESGQRVRG